MNNESFQEILDEIVNTETVHQFLFLLFPRPFTMLPFGLPLGFVEVEIVGVCLDDIQVFLLSSNSGR